MLRLTLLRHAKSSWATPRVSDEKRPLNDRGKAAAPLMGRFMAEKKILPDLVLCSAAVRTRQTADAALAELPKKPRTLYEDELYLADEDRLLARLRQVKKGVRHVLMIGHNPGFQNFAVALIGEGDADDIEAISEKLPTAAVVEISFAVDKWADIEPGAGRLERYTTPKRLAATADTDQDAD